MAIATSTVSSETMGSAASTLLNTRKYSLICYSSYKEKILIGKDEKIQKMKNVTIHPKPHCRFLLLQSRSLSYQLVMLQTMNGNETFEVVCNTCSKF